MSAGKFTSAPAVKLISPVPVGSKVISAFEPLDTMSFVVTEVAVSVPVTVGVEIVGLVIVLFVKVCEPVNVATVESIANVTALPDPDVSIPVPPVNVIVSESRSIERAPPESP